MQKKDWKKKILITGGSGGIGASIARKFFDQNWKVAVADIQKPQQDQDDFSFFSADVSKADDIDRLYKDVKEELGIPEVLVLNAGRGIQEKLTEGDPDKWQEIININLMGALRCIRAFVPEMLEKKDANVVFISSVAAGQPHQYGGIYTATKTALEAVAETLRLETLPDLNVTVISPGITDTNFFSNQLSGDNSVKSLDMGWLLPEEIAEDVFYAVSRRKGSSINKIITRPIKQSF